MRNLWLGLALVPFFAAAGADAWTHERGRRVPRTEQWIHGGLALAMAAFLTAVFAHRAPLALALLGLYVALVAWDELGFHRSIAASERRLHFASWAALAFFVAAWWFLDAP